MRKRPKKCSSDQPGIICGSVLDPSCKHPEPNQMLWGRLQSGIWITPWEAIIGGSCHNYHFCHDKRVCRNKSLFVMTKVYLVSQNCCSFVVIKYFQNLFCDRHSFVMTKDVFCHDKHTSHANAKNQTKRLMDIWLHTFIACFGVISWQSKGLPPLLIQTNCNPTHRISKRAQLMLNVLHVHRLLLNSSSINS